VAELDDHQVAAALGGTTCTVLHVDMDAFFAAVEVLDDPSLAGRPVIVGGAGARGVVASCTYEARAYGIRSAMSSIEARRRCPEALFLAGRYARYVEMSERLFAVLTSFTPEVEGVGLDEAFLYVAGARRLLGHPVEIAHLIRAKVRDDMALGCSVGVARSKMLAKLASRAAKPVASLQGTKPGRGVFVVAPADELAFLHPMSIRALWGVGPATAGRLEGLGVTTVGELARVPGDVLRRAIGAANGHQLAALARGEDSRGVVARRPVKSVGHEQTFAVDFVDRADLHPHVVRMADAVGARLHESGQRGRTVTLKVRFADRRTITRSHTASAAMDSPRALALIAGALLDAVDVGPGVRLLGVSVSGLDADRGAGEQLRFGESEDGEPAETEDGQPAEPGRAGRDRAWQEVDAALGAIRARYGQSSVGPATLVGPRGLAVKGRGDTQWGPGSDAETALPAPAARPRED
jgi:DNA polymerase IV